MFGISGAEFLVILIFAILVVPARNWPDVARFLARVVRMLRGLVWRLTDMGEKIKSQIELEKPIESLIHTTTNDILSDFSEKKKSLRKIQKITTSSRTKK